jgi:hypothetical protein
MTFITPLLYCDWPAAWVAENRQTSIVEEAEDVEEVEQAEEARNG